MKKHEIFTTNPNLKEVHMTSDGQSFYNDSDARMHAKSLKDKKVELVVNPDFLEVIDDEVVSDLGDDAPVVVDLKKLNKAGLIKYAKDNELTLDETLTNAKMVESIEAQITEKLNIEKSSEDDLSDKTQE